jgi:hypothetical protein
MRACTHIRGISSKTKTKKPCTYLPVHLWETKTERWSKVCSFNTLSLVMLTTILYLQVSNSHATLMNSHIYLRPTPIFTDKRVGQSKTSGRHLALSSKTVKTSRQIWLLEQTMALVKGDMARKVSVYISGFQCLHICGTLATNSGFQRWEL